MTTPEFHAYISDCLSFLGDIRTIRMMGEYVLYYRDKVVGDLCDNRLLIKQTPTSQRLLADCSLEYPYPGSKQLMFVIADPENRPLMRELFDGLYAELPERKPKKKSST